MPPLIRPSSVDEAGDAVRQVIRAYHASPHDFDQFSAKFIGTGEGARSFGHGLYFAESPAVREAYYKKFASQKIWNKDMLAKGADLPRYFEEGRVIQTPYGHDKVVRMVPRDELPGWMPWAVDVVRVNPDGSAIPGESVRRHATQPTAAEVDRALGRPPATRYEVEINYSPEELLDWDAPVLHQSPAVQEALGKFAEPSYGFPGLPESWRGRHAYELATKDLRGPARASKALQKQGIPGLRYLDGMSRRAGEGTRNFVIFPGAEDQIRILRKFAVPGVVGAGAAAMGGED